MATCSSWTESKSWSKWKDCRWKTIDKAQTTFLCLGGAGRVGRCDSRIGWGGWCRCHRSYANSQKSLNSDRVQMCLIAFQKCIDFSGVPHPRAGEVPRAYVIRGDQALTETDIKVAELTIVVMRKRTSFAWTNFNFQIFVLKNYRLRALFWYSWDIHWGISQNSILDHKFLLGKNGHMAIYDQNGHMAFRPYVKNMAGK